MKKETTTKRPAETGHRHEDELRRDRVLGITVLVLFAGLLGLLFWLASVSGVPGDMKYDYWLLP